jgi:hypothetical protein
MPKPSRSGIATQCRPDHIDPTADAKAALDEAHLKALALGENESVRRWLSHALRSVCRFASRSK